MEKSTTKEDMRPFLVFNETSDLWMYQDVVECVEFPTICGPNSNCTNLIGSYNCTCNSGYRLNNLEVIASITNPCTGARPLVWCVCVYVCGCGVFLCLLHMRAELVEA